MQLIGQIWLVALSWGLLGECNKEDLPPTLFGDWRWTASSGGFATTLFKARAGERVMLRFRPDGQFSLYQNDTLMFSGSFRLTKARSIYSGKDESKIEAVQLKATNLAKKPRHVVFAGIIRSLSTSQLSIGDNAYDGLASEFVRN